jgi:hypothetical protein
VDLKRKKKAFNAANGQALSLAKLICQEELPGPGRHLRGLALVAYVAVSEILADQLTALDGKNGPAQNRSAA